MYTKDEGYYFTLITIRIEDCLFRVPRHRFEEHSEVFRSMFSLPSGRESVKEGGTDENPIHIDGVDKQSFRYFLNVLYPPPATSIGVKCPEANSYTHVTDRLREFTDFINARRGNGKADEWLAILRLAHMWEFTGIHDLAIANLERMSLPEVQKVEIANKFSIHNWYIPAYKALVKRPGALSVEEAMQLGFEFAIKLAGIRERWIARTPRTPGYRNVGNNFSSDLKTVLDDAVLEADITATFKVTLPNPQKTVQQPFGTANRQFRTI